MTENQAAVTLVTGEHRLMPWSHFFRVTDSVRVYAIRKPGFRTVSHVRACTAAGLSGRQKGAAAIEFALVFPLFFILFYAIVAYSLVMTLDQSLTHAAAEGARAAVAVDPAAFPGDAEAYKNKIEETACATVSGALAWLSTQPECKSEFQSDSAATTLSVTLKYPYASAPLVPVLDLSPLFGRIPNVPDPLVVQATIRI
jgi:Flp pilus assembly protein TadG